MEWYYWITGGLQESARNGHGLVRYPLISAKHTSSTRRQWGPSWLWGSYRHGAADSSLQRRKHIRGEGRETETVTERENNSRSGGSGMGSTGKSHGPLTVSPMVIIYITVVQHEPGNWHCYTVCHFIMCVDLQSKYKTSPPVSISLLPPLSSYPSSHRSWSLAAPNLSFTSMILSFREYSASGIIQPVAFGDWLCFTQR